MLDNNPIDKIKNSIKQNVLHVKNFNDVDDLLYWSTIDKYLVFDSIILKNYFINNTKRMVINCNSSYEKFIDEMENCFDENTIFNNVNFCNDISILNIIDKTNNLKID